MKAIRAKTADFESLTRQAVPNTGVKAPNNHWGSKSSAERLKRGDIPKPQTLTGLLIVLGNKISRATNFDRGYEDDVETVKVLYAELLSEGGLRSAAALEENKGQIALNDGPAITQALELLGAHLLLEEGLATLGESTLFRPDDPNQIYFLTYRFTSKPGYIQRSFTVVHRPSSSLPVTRFANYFEHKGRVRQSHGMVLPFAKQLLFIGQSDGGEAPKIMSIAESKPQNDYSGLLLSFEPDGDMVACRFLMCRTKDIQHHDKAGTGPKKISESGLTNEQIDKIRNRIPFVLENGIEDENGNEIEQREMVTLVASLLLRKGRSGNHLLNMKAATAAKPLFNPADHEHYTFNAALKQID